MLKVLLILYIIVAFILGLMFMNKIDLFFEKNYCRDNKGSKSGNLIRIGFSNTSAAESMAHYLEKFSKKHKNTVIKLFNGSDIELMQGISKEKLDIAFLSVDNLNISNKSFESRRISVERAVPEMRYGGLEIEPLNKGPEALNAVWNKKSISSITADFIKLLDS